jgi:hypothetical protein
MLRLVVLLVLGGRVTVTLLLLVLLVVLLLRRRVLSIALLRRWLTITVLRRRLAILSLSIAAAPILLGRGLMVARPGARSVTLTRVSVGHAAMTGKSGEILKIIKIRGPLGGFVHKIYSLSSVDYDGGQAASSHAK